MLLRFLYSIHSMKNLHAGDPGPIPLNEEYRKATSSALDDNGLP